MSSPTRAPTDRFSDTAASPERDDMPPSSLGRLRPARVPLPYRLSSRRVPAALRVCVVDEELEPTVEQSASTLDRLRATSEPEPSFDDELPTVVLARNSHVLIPVDVEEPPCDPFDPTTPSQGCPAASAETNRPPASGPPPAVTTGARLDGRSLRHLVTPPYSAWRYARLGESDRHAFAFPPAKRSRRAASGLTMVAVAVLGVASLLAGKVYFDRHRAPETRPLPVAPVSLAQPLRPRVQWLAEDVIVAAPSAASSSDATAAISGVAAAKHARRRKALLDIF